jgi:hypothetical protein
MKRGDHIFANGLLKRFRLTKHMVGGVGAGLAGFDGWLFPGEPRRRR